MGFWTKSKKSVDDTTEGEPSMSDATTIDLGEVLDISFAARLHGQLKDEVKAGSKVKLSCNDLSRIDASCLQVLAGFMNYAKENDITVEWQQPGEVLQGAARLTGLEEILQLNG